MSASTIDNLLVIGTGLIGGSLALALKRAGAVKRVVGFGRSTESLERAVLLGVIDEFTLDPRQAATRADMVFLSVPVGVMAPLLQTIAPHVGENAIITDGGSTKLQLISDAREALGSRFPRFVPGHPIAGSERSGVEAARDDLYVDHRVLLTPVHDTAADAVERVNWMWRQTGARVDIMEADVHDAILGMTSHLPHVLAFALVDFIARRPDAARCFDLAAGGFIDFTRIASSDPVVWRDISISNAASLGRSLDEFIAELNHLRSLIVEGRTEDIQRIFENARRARGHLIDNRRRHQP